MRHKVKPELWVNSGTGRGVFIWLLRNVGVHTYLCRFTSLAPRPVDPRPLWVSGQPGVTTIRPAVRSGAWSRLNVLFGDGRF